MAATEQVDANLWSSDLSDALGAIEVQAALLVRNFELLRRRGDIYGDLDKSSYLLLRTLEVTGPVDISALATALGLDPSTVGRQVTAMRAADLVERRAAEDDRRRCVITATEKGRRLLAETRHRRRERTAELLDGWTEDELTTLATMFRKYNGAVAEHYGLGRAT
jgi:DNA-binding MarR family transcriptional regulator